MSASLYLASKSPQRKALLEQIKVDFITLDVDIDESIYELEEPEDYCQRVAKEKAQAGLSHLERTHPLPVLAADTCVVLGQRILTKPKDIDDARQMLQDLSGQTHQVLTAVCVADEHRMETALSLSQVSFAILAADELEAYLSTKESLGRAGSYAIQGVAAKFISHIEGSYSGVVGLPLYETAHVLKEFSPYI